MARSVPRGKHRKLLQERKCIEKLEIYCTMSASEVRDAILGAFAHLLLKSFVYLSVNPTQCFTVDSVQDKHGNVIADGGKTIIYIRVYRCELCIFNLFYYSC